MSRLAKKPIVLPKGVEVTVSKEEVNVKGPKGNLSHKLPEGIRLVKGEEGVTFELVEGFEIDKPILGLHRSLIQNAIVGVSAGFEKRLQLIGVGYRAAIKGAKLDLQLGFSHPCEIAIPSQLKIEVDKSVLIIISGIDKNLVGHFAAAVRSVKPPEPYKGKGIRYVDEFVRKKAGKAAKGK
ncbi:MAG: 50S ribosomal protein L6 [Chlamydiae bacterium]|nr:50S ribosomal protein L6 [Chlamydiota bacterium]